MNRRGFTLLELMLAMLVGSMVVLAATGMFFFFSRSDRAHQLRFEEMDGLSRIHLVMDRAMTTLVLSSEARPASPGDTGEGRVVRSIPTQGASSQAREPKNALPVPARIILGPSPASHAIEPPEARPGRVLGDLRAMDEPQRLEVVVLRPPVPQDPRATLDASSLLQPTKGSARDAGGSARNAGGGARDAGGGARDAGGGARGPGGEGPDKPARNEREPAPDGEGGDAISELVDGTNPGDTIVQAYRGAFELRPMDPPHVPRADGSIDPRVAWELWWIPLPPRTGVGEGESPSAFSPLPAQPAGRPYLIARRLSFVQWRAFDDRARRTQYVATRWDDLPAYVELEVETVSGLKANWLFEVMGISGGEVATRSDEADPEAPDANRDQGSGGAAGAAGKGAPTLTPGKPGGRVKGKE